VLILTRDEVIPVLRSLTCIPATTTRRGIPTEVELGLKDGMPRECVLSADNLATVDAAFLTRWITDLGSARMRSVCEAVRIATGC
jgi:mRNA interferase MazF